ncbi:MAG: DUF2167 domain-containing protein [Verrucomicrobiota bacterium]|jgi:uncharacterized membrane-anchored protein
MRTKLCVVLVGLVFAAAVSLAEEHPKTRAEAEQLAKRLKYQQGEINLQGGIAKLNVPSGFRYLNPDDTKIVLETLWGNPPSTTKELGMLMPSDRGPLDSDSWAVLISYAGDGYVKDDDAGKINYDDLLKKMQSAVQDNNKKRIKQGYPSIELVGWAAPPHYDAASHKLYWAKELRFDGTPANTLNYDIRILGRRGVLVLSAVAAIDQLGEIEKVTPQILGMVNFNEGHRYADFDPKVDKVATYGIAALVAGGVAAKLGLFKLLWVFVLAAKKFIIIAFVAVAAWFRKLFQKDKKTPA